MEKTRKAAYALLAFALSIYAVSNCVRTIKDLRRFYTNMWIWDPWDYLSHYAGYQHFDLATLWIQHNEHREIGTEITYIIDSFLFHGKQFVPELTGIAAYVGVLMVMVAFVWFWAEDRWATGCAALLAVAIAGYKTCAVSLAIPFLTSWPQWEFFGVAALGATVLHQKRRGKLFFLTAIVFAIFATYSMSNGMLVWPLLIVAALLLRFDGRQVLTIGIVGAASIGLYFVHYRNLHSLSLNAAAQHPFYFAEFLGSFLGMPFNSKFQGLEHVILVAECGWIALTILAIDIVWIVRKKLYDRPAVIVTVGFCLLAVASSILTALGRMNPDDPNIVAARAGRYVTEPTLFWCALLMLTVWLIGRSGKGFAALAFLMAASLLTTSTLSRNNGFYVWWTHFFQQGQWASIGFANGVTDNAVGDVLFPSREYLAQFKHVLIDNHLAMFGGPEPGWIGRQAQQTFARGSDGDIHGEVTCVKKLGHDFEVQGWADGVNRVLFVDEAGRIIGFGIRPNAGPAELYTHDVPPDLAFTGFIRGDFGAHKFSLFAVDRKGRVIWRTGRLFNDLPQ